MSTISAEFPRSFQSQPKIGQMSAFFSAICAWFPNMDDTAPRRRERPAARPQYVQYLQYLQYLQYFARGIFRTLRLAAPGTAQLK